MVKVAVRLRPSPGPFGARADIVNHQVVLNASNGTTVAHDFDVVFPPTASQEEVYKAVVAPLVKEALDGGKAMLIAYGTSGTGKTYTIKGNLSSKDLKGVLPRAIDAIFDGLGEGDSASVQFLQVYENQVQDLLAVFTDASKSKVHKSKKTAGVKPIIVKNAGDAIEQFKKGEKRRAIAGTAINTHSSRSHCVFTIKFIKKYMENGQEKEKTGQLDIVDLAGAENAEKSGATGKRAEEARFNNQSLSAFHRVIEALAKNQKHIHVPFLDSTLTTILKGSLGGGETNIWMIACISPSLKSMSENKNTLTYASHFKGVDTTFRWKAVPAVLNTSFSCNKLETSVMSRASMSVSRIFAPAPPRWNGSTRVSGMFPPDTMHTKRTSTATPRYSQKPVRKEQQRTADVSVIKVEDMEDENNTSMGELVPKKVVLIVSKNIPRRSERMPRGSQGTPKR